MKTIVVTSGKIVVTSTGIVLTTVTVITSSEMVDVDAEEILLMGMFGVVVITDGPVSMDGRAPVGVGEAAVREEG